MTRVSLAEEYDNRDMVAQMIALKNRQTESENNLLTYVAQCAQSAADADSAKDDAEAARDTAVAAATDTVRKTPSAAQTITGYPLTVTQGITANLTGNVTGNVTGNLTGDVTGNVTGNATTATTATKLGSSTVGTALKPIFINAGTATVCNEMCDLVTAQTVTGTKTFSNSPVVPTETTGVYSTKAANGTKVKNELDNYSPMVRTTGNQTVGGSKTFTNVVEGQGTLGNQIIRQRVTDLEYNDPAPSSSKFYDMMPTIDSNGVYIGSIRIVYNTNGTVYMLAVMKNRNGTEKAKTIAYLDAAGEIN